MKQLQAILSKPDSQLTDDDREFMWSKRLNVGSIPEALSKVLLSAPEKNYTGEAFIMLIITTLCRLQFNPPLLNYAESN